MGEPSLIIATDSEAPNWLEYIIEEFITIQQPQFSIQFISKDGPVEGNVIYYSLEKTGKCWIPDRSAVPLSNEIEFISDDIYLHSGTRKEGWIPYDLLWNAFVFLSRKEEFEYEKSVRRIYSYQTNHPRKNKNTFKIPIVNNLFSILERKITNAFPELTFESSQKFKIELSHDLDYIRKTFQLRSKQTVFNGFNTFKTIAKPRQFYSHIHKSVKFLFQSPMYWCFDYWTELEKKYEVRSVFYIYAHDGKKKNPRSWLIDPSYDIKSNKRLQDQLKELHKDGFSLGLHGSYDSAIIRGLLKRQKEILENTLDVEISKTRQHWLNYKEDTTPYMHNEIFKEDSTIGWNDDLGFRAGCASRYRPYDHRNQKSFQYNVIPQVIMDSHIVDYAGGKTSEREDQFHRLLDEVKKHKNTNVSISWHPRTYSEDYNWHFAYERLLEYLYRC